MMESMRNRDVTAVRRRGGLGGLVLDGGPLGGPIEENEQACTDPKDCPQPMPLRRDAPLDADEQACTDPKDCPQPAPTAVAVPQ
jgi:hypothetical protein